MLRNFKIIFTNPDFSNETLFSRSNVSNLEIIIPAFDFSDAINKFNLFINNSTFKNSSIVFSECSEIIELSNNENL
jgi:hypothetical protein